MKKNTFVEGAFVVTMGIIICKIIGILYVIPFYSLIGSVGGALYSYAYSIYAIFLSLSSTGIPLAMSKIISEYQSMNFFDAKNRAYKIGQKLMFFIGLLSFLLLFLFSDKVAFFIVGNIDGGNSIESISFVIKVISLALLIVPNLSVSRGYLQGHKLMNIFSKSNIIEQLVRVLVILVGSFLSLKIFHFSIEITVGIAVLGATIGAIAAYIYIKIKNPVKKIKLDLNDEDITNNMILKKIILYSIPFIIIDIMKSLFSMIDTFTLVRGLNSLEYNISIAEKVISIISTWGNKINNIIISFAIGIIINLIPNIASSFVKKDYIEVSNKINLTLFIILVLIVPITFFTCIFADYIWSFFYGYDIFSINLFKIYVFQALSFSFFSVLINITQTLNYTKINLFILMTTIILKFSLNIPMMHLFNYLNLPPYYGNIILTIIIQIIIGLFLMIYLKEKKIVNYSRLKEKLLGILFSLLFFAIVVLVFYKISHLFAVNRFVGLLITILEFIVSLFIYGLFLYKLNVFDNNFINIKRKMHKNSN